MGEDWPPSEEWINGYIAHLRHHGTGRGPARESTIETYAGLLRRLDRDLPEGVAYADADELRDAIFTDGRGDATRALYRAACVDFFRWACDGTLHRPYLDFNPSIHLPRQRVPRGVPRPAPSAQLDDIMARAAQPYLTWYLLAAANGLRCCEISALDRQHIDAEDMLLHGKGGKQRVVPTHPDVWAAVRDLPAGPVARTLDGGRASRKSVMQRGNRHLQRTLGQVGITMHRLRHWHGTNVHESSGDDLAAVQELLGHASPNTTRIYVDVHARAKRAAIDGLVIPGVRRSGEAGDAAA